MTTIPFDAQRLRQLCLGKTYRVMSGYFGFGAVITPDSKVTSINDYTFIDNGADILAVAHCDTVDHTPTFSKALLSNLTCYFSPAMDDRLGVYTILDVLPQLGLKYDVLLTTNEERGLSTAEAFVHPDGKKYHWMFEFDRRGTGAVFYQYDHTALRTAAEKFFKHDFGSFSDISVLGHLGCAGINVGTGYNFEHTYYCHMILLDWRDQVERFVRFYNVHKNDVFPYLGGKYLRQYGYYDYEGWNERGGTTSAIATTGGVTYPIKPTNTNTSHIGVTAEKMPEFMKDWIKAQTSVPSFVTYIDLREFVDSLPSAVGVWIDDLWIADRDPGHPANEIPWWNWWMKTYVGPHVPAFKDPKSFSADEVMELHQKYILEREKTAITEESVGLVVCENCAREPAEFFKDGIYTCADCDDMLWYANFYNPNSNNGG